MIPGYIHYRSSLVHYQHVGKGGSVFICFHGYGEIASSFELLAETIKETQTVIAIDLPYHGKTEWNETAPFTIDDLSIILRQIRQELHCSEPTFSLVGYSMGGRVALAYCEKYAHQISKLILLAPDGLKINFWYRLATQTTIGNAFFKFTMRKPGWFMWMLRLANRIGMINPSIYKFTHYYIDNPVVRKELYERWTGLRKIKPNLLQVQRKVNAAGTRICMLFGKHDRIILPVNGQRFAKQVHQCEIIILPGGHRLLDQKNIPAIVQIMLS